MADTDAPASIFGPDGPDRYVPTQAALGPWNPNALAGGALTGLLAHLCETRANQLVRLTVELPRPVPKAPLYASHRLEPSGRRVQRERVELRSGSADGPLVAYASALTMRRAETELESLTTTGDGDLPFGPPPDRDELADPTPLGRQVIPWRGFFDLGVHVEPAAEGPIAVRQFWLALRLPLIAGEPNGPFAALAVGADYAGTQTSDVLPIDRWSFMNADVTAHLTRDPEGPWVGVSCSTLAGPQGSAVGTAGLFDRRGRLGGAETSLLLEPR
jgi:hypothetical protein